MKNEALKDIQAALNIIRSATDKEESSAKIEVLELMTQSLLSTVQSLKPIALVQNKLGDRSKSKRNKPAPVPIPKSLNTPALANNPNATVPNQPQSQVNNTI